MATAPRTALPSSVANGRWPALALCLSLSASLLAGCSPKPGAVPTPAGSPVAVASPATTPVLAGGMSYAEITEKYQAPVPEAENGWPLVKPLLVAVDPAAPSPTERWESLTLADKPADRAIFDKEVLPKLKEGFNKPYFLQPHRLLSGRDPLNMSYRNVRLLCDMLADRADLLWKDGKKSEALELLRLPLALAKALQSRPETVSVNLFSLSYANASLRDIAEWASDNSLKGPELEQAAKLLAQYRPSYSHVQDTISVDFAQLDNSLSDSPTRSEMLGLGLASNADIKLWREQAQSLLGDAQKLFGFELTDPQTFESAVLKMSPQVHGLVLEYPSITTMQKKAYASYLATELALSLERRRMAKDKTPLDATKLVQSTFAGDEEAQKSALGLLEYHAGKVADNFSIVGRGDVFKLISPDGNAVLYQR